MMKIEAVLIAMSLVFGTTALSTVTTAQTSPTPKSHMMLANPANLSGDRADAVYQAIRQNMRAHYLVSGDPVAGAYQNWRRYNKVPYRSSLHGALLVNNYANATAAGYGKYERLGSLPAGSIVVKDSFSVTEGGEVTTGPLFLMEKREKGFNTASNDWLYMMINPNGAVAGITKGENTAAVRFCAECHNKAAKGQDNLYFLPKKIRRRN
jgi:hypothetical protein